MSDYTALLVLADEMDAEVRRIAKSFDIHTVPSVTVWQWANRLRDAITALAPPAQPRNIEDALHEVFTQHGIASRSEYKHGLISDLIGWAAAMCRQSHPTPADRAAVAPAPEGLDSLARALDRIAQKGRMSSVDVPILEDAAAALRACSGSGHRAGEPL